MDQFYEFWLPYYQIYLKSYIQGHILDHFEDSISKKSNFWHLKIGQIGIFYFLKFAKIKIWNINQNWNCLKLHFWPLVFSLIGILISQKIQSHVKKWLQNHLTYPTLIFPPQTRDRGRVSIRISRFCVVVDRVFSHNKKGGSAGTSVGWWWRRTTQKLSRGDDLIDCKLSPSQQLDLTAAESEQCIDGIKSLSMETSWAFKKITRAATSSTKFMTRGYILNNSNYYFRSE